MLCCWYTSAVLRLHRFSHTSTLVWVISTRKCSMLPAKAVCFTTLFLILPHVPSHGQPSHRSLSQAAGCQPPFISGCPKHRASAWLLSQLLSCCGPFWLLVLLARSWVSLMSPVVLPHSLFNLRLWTRLSEGQTEAAGTKNYIWVDLRAEREERYPLKWKGKKNANKTNKTIL